MPELFLVYNIENMKYAVMSDTHDNLYNFEKAVEKIKAEHIETCFHLGDFCAPSMFRAMAAHKDLDWICVWGNVDGAKAKIILDFSTEGNINLTDESFREFDVPEGKVFLAHFPLLSENAAKSGKYIAAFYGDNHTKKVEKIKDQVLLANPGELTGTATGQPSFGIWDSAKNDFEIIDLKDSIVAR